MPETSKGERAEQVLVPEEGRTETLWQALHKESAKLPLPAEVIIVCGGDLLADFTRSYLAAHPGAYLIAADRGLLALQQIGVRPDLLVGDYDSAEKTRVSRYLADGGISRAFPSCKDYTDGEAAMMAACALHPRFIGVIGATGGRLDHFLCHLQILRMALREGIDAEIADPQNRIFLTDRDVSIPKDRFGSYLSLLPFTDQVRGLSLAGTAYPLSECTLTKGKEPGHLISNRMTDAQAKVFLREGILIVILSKDREGSGV